MAIFCVTFKDLTLTPVFVEGIMRLDALSGVYGAPLRFYDEDGELVAVFHDWLTARKVKSKKESSDGNV